MSMIVNNSAKASHPGRIKIEPAKFLSYLNVNGLRKYFYLLKFSRLSKESPYRKHSNDSLVMQ